MTNGSQEPTIGIDLGTTYSVVARLDEHGHPATLVNSEGDRLTPSVVLFDGNDVIVGKEAVKAMTTEAERVAECSKRDMGYRVFHKVFDGKQYPPEVIEAWILNKLRRDTESQVGPLEKVVITVPAYFDEVRRKATQDAGSSPFQPSALAYRLTRSCSWAMRSAAALRRLAHASALTAV